MACVTDQADLPALVGVIAVQTRVRDLLVPLLGLPLLLPVDRA